jgi:hypothetical protein
MSNSASAPGQQFTTQKIPVASGTSRESVAFTMFGVVIILCIYCYPALRTTLTTRFTTLPPICAPDLGLDLNVSAIEPAGPGLVLDPYYRTVIPAHGTGYLEFRFATKLFGWFTKGLGGRMWLALFLWNLVWWALLCISVLWLFDRFSAQRSRLVALAGLALLMLFNVGMLKTLMAALFQSSSLSVLKGIELPYIRSFFPQVIMPALLVYLGLQMRALGKKSDVYAWTVMGLLQFWALGAFPYAALMMVGITATTVVWWILSGMKVVRWQEILTYGLLCAVVDLVFLISGRGAFRTGSPGQPSFFDVQLSLLPQLMGKLWIGTGLLTAAVAFSRNFTPEVKWPLVGLGVTNLALLLGDAVIPVKILFLTAHASYFEHATFVILLTFLASALGAGRWSQSSLANYALRAVICGLLVYGGLLAQGNYRISLPFNQVQADLSRFVLTKNLGTTDLVIADYDATAWVPLVSKAPVLYNRGAQAILPPAQNQELERFREVLYLYFIGKDGRWVQQTTTNGEAARPLERYGLFGDVSIYQGAELTQRLLQLRSELTPMFDRVEGRDPKVADFFRQFTHVWIIDDRAAPIFDPAKLSTYLDLKSEENSGSLRVVLARPR